MDHYRLDERVAEGGMATIFRATDLRSDLRVAIKVPHPEAECDPALFTRFQREAEIGRMLDHLVCCASFRQSKAAAYISSWNGWRAFPSAPCSRGRNVLTRRAPLESPPPSAARSITFTPAALSIAI